MNRGDVDSGIGTLVKDASLVTPNGVVDKGWIWLRDGVIQAIGAEDEAWPAEANEASRMDAKGGWVLPGFIDVHVHGGAGYDFMDAGPEGIDAIARFHSQNGTTSLLATTLTASREELTAVLDRVATYAAEPMPYAQVAGVHLEGPFISPKWPGAQHPGYIVPPQAQWLDEWVARHPGLIKIQTLAPESEGALDYIERLAAYGIVPSCGHTDATYDQV
ncbi:amidohydrolase family protein, partial [Cohnella lubricantis]